MTLAGGLLGFASGVGSNLIAGNDFGKFDTWIDIGISTGIGTLFGAIGGAGATNSKSLDSALKKSSQYLKAATSYDKVLTKIATGSYKNLAGAAGARAITSKTLQIAWQSVVNRNIAKNIGINLILSIIQSIIDSIF